VLVDEREADGFELVLPDRPVDGRRRAPLLAGPKIVAVDERYRR
jgi:hypothetical protein